LKKAGAFFRRIVMANDIGIQQSIDNSRKTGLAERAFYE
jgi:hypothetical protein